MGPLTTALLVVFVAAAASFVVKLWKARSFFAGLQKLGLPMPQHSFAAGHLPVVKAAVDTYPSDAHKIYSFGKISRSFSKSGAFYLDLWPLSEPFLIVTSPTLANQATQSTSIAYEKPDGLRNWFLSLSGGVSLFDAPSQQWKPLRALFSPGFSQSHLMTLVPTMVEETLLYCDTLREHARKGDMFCLDPTTLRLMMDMIGKIVLNADLHAQKGYNALADALLNQIQWKISNQEVNPLSWINLPRWTMEWYNSRQMDAYIHKELDRLFKAYQSSSDNDSKRGQSIVDLALRDYMGENTKTDSRELETDFRDLMTVNVRMLLFAGVDSTSSTICYCFHLLHANPASLALVRAEHDIVFGSDISTVPSAVSREPHLLNQLPYTNAVIKETMRLFPAAAGLRQGAAGIDLIDEDGTRYPTENTMIWILHPEIHRSPLYWPRPTEFLPERWLVGSDDPLYPSKGAWRPFEMGPRNCIGQGLVMIDIKVVLVMTVREFDIAPMYSELDRLKPESAKRTVEGERVYQIEEGAAHPVQHYPCKVTLRS